MPGSIQGFTAKLQKLIGTLNWFEPFLPRHSESIVTITDQLKLPKQQWTEDMSQIINELSAELEKPPKLAHPNNNLPFDLHTDASDQGCGAHLSQDGKLNQLFC